MQVDFDFIKMLAELNQTLRDARKIGLRKEHNAQVLIEDGRDFYEVAAQLREAVDEIEAKLETNRQDRKDARAGRLIRDQWEKRGSFGLDLPAEELVYDIVAPSPKALWRAERREHLRQLA